MMEKNNRTSYLAPPAPRALNRDGSRDSTSFPLSKEPTIPSQNTINSISTSGSRMTPTSGEIPLEIAQQDIPGSSKSIPSNYRSPALPSLEHLSLETGSDSDMRPSPKLRINPPPIYINGNNNGQYPRNDRYEPASAVDPPSRPFFGSRSSSSNQVPTAQPAALSPSPAGIGARTMSSSSNGGGPGLNLPLRGGPPSGPLPMPPMSAGMSPRRNR